MYADYQDIVLFNFFNILLNKFICQKDRKDECLVRF